VFFAKLTNSVVEIRAERLLAVVCAERPIWSLTDI